MDHLDERERLSDVMARLCRAGLTTSTGGNASVRVAGGCLITPSGLDKLSLAPSDMIRVYADRAGDTSPDEDSPLPSMETGMHLAIYRARPDISAVIHAHPLFATAYSATENEIRFDLTGESRALLGRVARIGFELMGSGRLADSVAGAFEKAETVILGNHGAAAAGDSLHLAFSRIETLETAAKISFVTRLLGQRACLSDDDLRMIDILFDGGDSTTIE